MNEQDVIDLINQWIVENNNNEITANVLNPVLLAMIQQPNLLIGDLGDLSTGENNNLVDAINWILTQISSGGITIHTGQNNPNETPPATYTVGDFYSQLDVMNTPLYLWQYTGTEWARITNYIDDNIEALDTTWSSHKISEAIKGDRLDGNPTIILDEDEITISGLSWWIQGNPYILIPPFTDTIPYTSELGYSRKDIIVAVQSNNLVRIQGDEGTGIVQPPQVPENTLLVTELDVYHDSVGEPTEPIIGSQFIPKESQRIVNIEISSSPTTISLEPSIGVVRITSAVQGAEILGTANWWGWSGHDLWIWNDTDEDIDLVNLAPSSNVDARFSFPEMEEEHSYILKGRHKAHFKFSPNGSVYEFFSAIPTADQISYDNAESGLEAENVQEAVDEVDSRVNEILENYISEGEDSEETIKHLSIKDEEGTEPETMYFIPKLHHIVKDGQLSVLKAPGNSELYPEENDIVEGFMTDTNSELWYVKGIYSGSGDFFSVENYELLNGTFQWT